MATSDRVRTRFLPGQNGNELELTWTGEKRFLPVVTRLKQSEPVWRGHKPWPWFYKSSFKNLLEVGARSRDGEQAGGTRTARPGPARGGRECPAGEPMMS